MRTYETLYIVHPELEEDAVQTVAQGVESLITENGGAIVRSEIWGKRRLAYEVKKHTEGIYVLVRFQADETFVVKLEQHYHLAEDIIRDLVIHMDEKTLRLEAEQEIRTKAQQEARASTGPPRASTGPPRGRSNDDEDKPAPRKDDSKETVEV